MWLCCNTFGFFAAVVLLFRFLLGVVTLSDVYDKPDPLVYSYSDPKSPTDPTLD